MLTKKPELTHPLKLRNWIQRSFYLFFGIFPAYLKAIPIMISVIPPIFETSAINISAIKQIIGINVPLNFADFISKILEWFK